MCAVILYYTAFSYIILYDVSSLECTNSILPSRVVYI
jgi:hypothetical protein